jgi:hypothetical protein
MKKKEGKQIPISNCPSPIVMGHARKKRMLWPSKDMAKD